MTLWIGEERERDVESGHLGWRHHRLAAELLCLAR